MVTTMTSDPAPSSVAERRRLVTAAATRLLVYFAVLAVVAVWPLLPLWAQLSTPFARLTIGVFVVACALGAALGTYDGLRPLVLFVSVFQYSWLAVAASAQLATGSAAWGDIGVTRQVQATESALLICSAFQLLLLLGYAVGRRGRNATPTQDRSLGPAQVAFLRRVAITLVLGALLLLPLVVATVGLGALFSSRSDLNQTLAGAGLTAQDTGTIALVKLLPGQLCVVAALVSLHALRSAAAMSTERRTTFRAVLVLSVGLLVVYANPLSSTRFISLAAFGAVALMALPWRGRLMALAALVVTLCGFLLVYPAANYFREGAAQATDPRALFTTPDFDGFQQVVNTVTMVEQVGFAMGSHIVSALLFFVPRSVWEGKATPASIEVAEQRGYVFTNLSLPLPAELFLDLGWIGLLVVAFAIGFAWRRLDRAWATRSQGAALAAYLAVAQIGIVRGPLGSLVTAYGVSLILLAAVMLRSRRLDRQPRAMDLE